MLALAAVLAAIVFVFPLLLQIPLLDPDEGLAASIAQEMVERGDWVTPRLLGQPFRDKPILYFWAEAISLRTFGMNEAAVRLPGLLLGLLGAVTTALVGWRMFGRTVGLVAGLFYTTMVLPAALAQAAAHDVALVPCINLALLMFWESEKMGTGSVALLRAGPPRRCPATVPVRIFSTLSIGVLLGLTVLTKGFVGIALIGVAYGSYLVIARRMTGAACIRAAAALGIAAAVAAPWYIAMEAANPGYLQYFFAERHLLGFATASQPHGDEPWWYYLPVLLGGGLPWIGYLPVTIQDDRLRRQPARLAADGTSAQGLAAVPAAKREIRAAERAGDSRPTLLLWCWLIGGAIFFTAARSKLVTYLWPVFPAAAILAAIGWARLIEGTLTEGARRLWTWTFLPCSLAAPAVLAAALIVVQKEFAVQFSRPIWTATILTGFVAWVPLAFWLAGRLRAALSAAVLSAAAQFAVVMALVLPQVGEATSARQLARHFNRLGQIPPQLLTVEARLGSLVFYLDRDLRAGLRQGQVQPAKLADLPRPKADTVLVLPERKVRQAGRYLDLSGVAYLPVGHYRLYRAVDLQSRLLAVAVFDACSQRSNQPDGQPARKQPVATRQPTAAPASTSLR
jgi:4-amino-4-deoxy-L-arabinose transferase-like glycosyltransferase